MLQGVTGFASFHDTSLKITAKKLFRCNLYTISAGTCSVTLFRLEHLLYVEEKSG